jgi:hypothetical protein
MFCVPLAAIMVGGWVPILSNAKPLVTDSPAAEWGYVPGRSVEDRPGLKLPPDKNGCGPGWRHDCRWNRADLNVRCFTFTDHKFPPDRRARPAERAKHYERTGITLHANFKRDWRTRRGERRERRWRIGAERDIPSRDRRAGGADQHRAAPMKGSGDDLRREVCIRGDRDQRHDDGNRRTFYQIVHGRFLSIEAGSRAAERVPLLIFAALVVSIVADGARVGSRTDGDTVAAQAGPVESSDINKAIFITTHPQ